MFFNQPYNKDTNEVSHLEGHVYQTLFDYKGEQYWLGADYYPVPEGYLVSYKAGLVKSWFASNFEYGDRFEDVIVNCAEDEIMQVILEHIENNKELAAERVLQTAYSVEDYFRMWIDSGNKAYYEKFKAFPQYTPHIGTGKSILIQSRFRASHFYLYCHINEEERNIQVFGTISDSGFSKVCDIALSPDFDGNYARLLKKYCADNRQLIDKLLMTSHWQISIARPTFTSENLRKMCQPHVGDELILWPDPAYTAGIDGGGASPAKASI